MSVVRLGFVRVVVLLCVGVVVCGVWCGGALGAGVGVVGPAWQVTDVAVPSVLPAEVGRKGKFAVAVEDIGALESSGVVVVRDVLPAGLTAGEVSREPEEGPSGEVSGCSVLSGREVVCEFPMAFVSTGFLVINVQFEVTGSVSGVLSNVASVSGGGALPASGSSTMRAGGLHELGPAGIAEFRATATGPAGEPFTQAAGHPLLLTTTLLLNNQFDESVGETNKPVEASKDLLLYLPLGMLGDPAVTEPCPASLVTLQGEVSGCPPSSRVGTILPMVVNNIFADAKDATHERGFYSVQPEKGFPAEFAFASNGLTFFFYASVVRHEGAYMLRIETPGLTPFASLLGFVASIYGDITEHVSRYGSTSQFNVDRGAFLTDPSDCQASGAALSASAEVNTWKEPGVYASASSPVFSSLEGCGLLGFSSVLSVKPETTQADAPSGYELGLEVPQAPSDGVGLGTPPLKDVSIRLPVGTTISPSAANGLEACQETGPAGVNIEGVESEAVGEDGLESPVAGHCPAASSIATVEGVSPLLQRTVEGAFVPRGAAVWWRGAGWMHERRR